MDVIKAAKGMANSIKIPCKIIRILQRLLVQTLSGY